MAADLHSDAANSLHAISFVTIRRTPSMQSMPESSNDGSTGPKERWTKAPGDKELRRPHVADHTVVKANVEEGVKGETVALCHEGHSHSVSTCASQSNQVKRLLCFCFSIIFFQHKDEDGAVYTDNSQGVDCHHWRAWVSSPNLNRVYVDSSKSFVEREIRHMLEGTRTNLVQSGLPVRMWPLAMQHFSLAVNASPQLNGDKNPNGSLDLVRIFQVN